MAAKKYFAELLGTFILVFVGSMTIVSAGSLGTPLLTVPFGFGLALLAGILAVGHISGAHFNPAVTLAMFLDGRTSASDLVGYWLSQFAGAIAASGVLALVTSRETVAGTITSHPGGTGLGIVSELILTTVFVLVILAVTRTAPSLAAVGISLTLVGVHFAGIPFSGASVNPARSLAPALIGGELAGLWVYLVFPLLGGLVAWGLWQFLQPEDAEAELIVAEVEEIVETETVEVIETDEG